MNTDDLTPEEYALIRAFFQSNFEWVSRNQHTVTRLMRKAENNLSYFETHPGYRPNAGHLLLGIFLMSVGQITKHSEEIYRLIITLDIQTQVSRTPPTPEEARQQVQSLLAQIKSELD